MISKYAIGCSANNNYAAQLGIMLYSLLKNCSKPENIIIYIADGGISKENKYKILSLEKKFKTYIKFITPDKKNFQELKTGRHFGIEAYYRLDLIKYVKEKKLLYLDCDTIIESDVIELLNKDLKNKVLLAVEDPDISPLNKEILGLKKSLPYFNSGVMLINIYKWKKQKISEKVIKYVRENSQFLEFADQDGLNRILKNKWVKLEPSWNYIIKSLPIIGMIFKKQSVRKINIIHYAGVIKPWFFLDMHPLRGRYWYYAKQTPWFEQQKQKNKNIFGVVGRLIDYKNFISKKFEKKREFRMILKYSLHKQSKPAASLGWFA